MSTLSDLMNTDPLKLTDPDIDEIIKAYRDMNYKFNLGDTRAGKVKSIGSSKVLENAEADELKNLLAGGLKHIK